MARKVGCLFPIFHVGSPVTSQSPDSNAVSDGGVLSEKNSAKCSPKMHYFTVKHSDQLIFLKGILSSSSGIYSTHREGTDKTACRDTTPNKKVSFELGATNFLPSRPVLWE